MAGIKKDDLKGIIEDNVKRQIKGNKQQNIVSSGVDGASFTVLSDQDPNNVQLTMSATASVGPALNKDDISKMAAGKKAGDVKSDLEKIDGVKKVEVTYSPFWVSKVPNKTSKITVNFIAASNSN